MSQIAVILGLLISIVHFYSEEIGFHSRHIRDELISFAAGVSLAYIFITLLPEFAIGDEILEKRVLFIFVLVGFTVLHIVEKYIYQHVKKKYALYTDLRMEDSIVSFVYHLFIGIILVLFTKTDVRLGILFFVPITLHTAASTLPVNAPKHKTMAALVASGTVLGAILATYTIQYITHTMFFAMMGAVVGALLFMITRHTLPHGKRGSPVHFIIGLLFYIAVFILTERLLF